MTRDAVPDAAQRMSYTMYLEGPPAELAAMHATASRLVSGGKASRRGTCTKNLMLPTSGLERLMAHAQQLVEAGELKAGRASSNYDRAKLLKSYLRNSGEFAYTLNLSVKDAWIDPVEDFLFNRKEGHCEYYASTLALMLRPSAYPRDWSRASKEPSLPRGPTPGKCRSDMPMPGSKPGRVTTCGSRSTPHRRTSRQRTVEAAASKVGFWERLQASSSTFWTDYVVQVTLQRQRKSTALSAISD